jgi:hypothetical protein
MPRCHHRQVKSLVCLPELTTSPPSSSHFSNSQMVNNVSFYRHSVGRQAEIKALTCRRTLGLPKEMIIQKLNEAARGWAGYFYYGNCSRNLATVKRFLEERVRIYLRRKLGKKSRGYRQYPNQYLYENLSLYKIPTTAPWAQRVKASGRR